MSQFVKTTNIDCSAILLEAGKMPILFSENDINYNVNKFLNHKVPVLWITGMSGGGKSTLANKLADETNADLLSLDSVKHFINLMIAEDKEVNDIIVQDKNFYLISKLLKKDADKYLENSLHGKKYLALLCYLVKEILKKHNNNNQIIIEGVQIPDMFWYNKSFYSENSAIIIKGTSLATSFFRRFKRDQGRGGFINKFSDIGKILRLYKEWYDYQNEFRATVTPNKESYSPPMSIADIKKNYPTKAGTLLKDPVHKWRAENGIELIHKEPTLDELDRIWKNWQLMTDKQKKISDDFSKKIFGKSNKEHYEELVKSYK